MKLFIVFLLLALFIVQAIPVPQTDINGNGVADDVDPDLDVDQDGIADIYEADGVPEYQGATVVEEEVIDDNDVVVQDEVVEDDVVEDEVVQDEVVEQA